MSEFAWWLLIVGMVVGAALAWLVVGDTARREVDITERELPLEAAWIAAALRDTGTRVAPEAVEEVLRLHREYRAGPPPDNLDGPDGAGPEAGPEPSATSTPDAPRDHGSR